MALTLAEAVQKIEALDRELAVWREVRGFLQGFVKSEEQDQVKKVITVLPWEEKGFPPAALVVPQGVVKSILGAVIETEIRPREGQVAQLKGLSIQDETGGTNGGSPGPGEGKRTPEKEGPVKEQGEQEGHGAGPKKSGRPKLGVAAKGPNPGKKDRRIVPKPARARSV